MLRGRGMGPKERPHGDAVPVMRLAEQPVHAAGAPEADLAELRRRHAWPCGCAGCKGRMAPAARRAVLDWGVYRGRCPTWVARMVETAPAARPEPPRSAPRSPTRSSPPSAAAWRA